MFLSFNKVFFGIKSCNTCLNAVFRYWQSHKMVLSLVHCPLDNTLFEVSPEISISDVSNRYCCYGNYTAASNPSKNILIVVNGELHKVCLCQNVVNWWSYFILIVAVRFFETLYSCTNSRFLSTTVTFLSTRGRTLILMVFGWFLVTATLLLLGWRATFGMWV